MNMLLTSAAIFALTFKQLELSLGWVVLVGEVIQGVYRIIFSAISYRSVTMALVMSLIFTVTCFFVGKSKMLESSQHIHPVIFSIATALEFTSGVLDRKTNTL
ncbi:hypothetical protein [Vagococcus lutrae]|uniref:hypothetical protein n=1 Tax=Vagococcus lutrae TaxID=81947 RepID=UPI0023A9B5F5|nr:hypothetical protein [Vagococcus lutrae]WEB81249.1 hypothetical protein LVJ09_08680 [Vagococcus lutrae]